MKPKIKDFIIAGIDSNYDANIIKLNKDGNLEWTSILAKPLS